MAIAFELATPLLAKHAENGRGTRGRSKCLDGTRQVWGRSHGSLERHVHGYYAADSRGNRKQITVPKHPNSSWFASGIGNIMQNNPILIPDTLPTRASYGRALRAYKRAKKKHRIQSKVIQLTEQLMPGLAYMPVVTNNYDNDMLLLLYTIDKDFSKPSERHIARWFVCMLIDKGNKEGYWDLVPPPALVKVRRHPQMRTLSWDNAASLAAQLSVDFQRSLNDSERFESLESVEALSLIALTASFYGGLNQVNAVSELIKTLQLKKPLPLGHLMAKPFIWVDLIYDDGRAHNITVDEKPCRYTRWFPDTHSLGLISRYQKFQSSESDIGESVSSLFGLLKQSLSKLGVDMPFSSMRALCKAGVSVFEAQPSVSLSSSLVETLCGRNLSLSMTPEYWDSIVSHPIYHPVELRYSDYATKYPTVTGTTGRRRTNKPPNISRIVYKLSKALAPTNSSKCKRSSDDVLSSLEELDSDGWPPMGIYLCKFYGYLFTERNLVPNSVIRYHRELANTLLLEDAKFPLEQLSPEDLFLTYRQIVDEVKGGNPKHYRAGRLDDFQQFAEAYCGYPLILAKIADGENSIPMIRTGYICNSLYQATLKSIQGIEGLDPVTIQGLMVLLILAYRTGLRLQELIKLRLCDIEPSEEYWLFVRSNKFGDNKHSAMPRKIPLAYLLTPTELEVWKTYFGRRNQFSSNDGELLFCHDGLGSFPLDPNMVSRLISNALRMVSGIPSLVFHHLRHTALSNMQLIAEREWELTSFLTGHTQKQVSNIFYQVFGNPNETLRIYWALATFAGHNSPQTTLQSYLHFSDIITYLKCLRTTTTYNISQCKSLSSLSSNKLTRIVHQNKLDAEAIPLEVLRESISTKVALTTHNNIRDISAQDSNASDNDLEVLPLKRRIHVSQAYEILVKYLDGFSIPALVYRYNVREERIELWITNMKSLSELKTKKGKSRLTNIDNGTSNKHWMLPHKPKSRVEEMDAFNIIEGLSKKVESNKEEVLWILNYYIHKTHKSSSGILFNNDADLNKFLSILTPDVISAKRWLFIIKSGIDWHSNRLIESRLENGYEGNAHSTKASTAYLYLRHPNESEYLERKYSDFDKYSASTLRYAFHMASIMAIDNVQ
jgi:integrase